MDQDQMKRAAALAALSYLVDDEWIGIGTGSTTNHFIDALAAQRQRIKGAVASSEASADRLRAAGIELEDLNQCGDLPVYVDGADEVTRDGYCIKGGGGALTREKIIAAASRKFVCIVDQSKLVKVLGQFPLPVEVIPMARSLVARKLVALGGRPQLRQNFCTDNGNLILDVHGLDLTNPPDMEQRINQIPGVVSNGLFAQRPADVVLLATPQGVQILRA